MPTYRTQLTTMTFLSTRDPLRDAEDRQSTPEESELPLSAVTAYGRFTLDPVSHHVSLCLISNFPFATWQCHCWLLDCVEVICENVARAARTL